MASETQSGSGETIGLIGVGLLGTAMAARLLRSGRAVRGFDLNPERMRALAEVGGSPADSVSELVSSCSRILLSLPDSAAVDTAINEIAADLVPGTLVIDTTTGQPQATVAVGARLADLGVSYVDATVVGSSQQAREGEIVMLVGGDDESWQKSRGLLELLARDVFHVGACGSGSQMKLVVNLVLGLNRAVLAEGLSLAAACGIDLKMALEVLRSGAAYSAAMDVKGSKMIAGDFAPQARLAQHHKDVGLILELGQRVGSQLPLSTVHEGLLRNAIERGFGQLDNSAIIKAFS